MKHKKYNINLTEWNLKTVEKFQENLSETIYGAVEDVLKHAIENETYIYFPVEWSSVNSDGIGGKKVSDPLTIYMRLGIESDNDEKPTFEFNLRDALKESLCYCEDDGSFSEGLTLLSKSLRELADEIDLTTKKHNKNVDSSAR